MPLLARGLKRPADTETAKAFSESWNRKSASVYTREQFLEWLAPVDPEEFRGKDVLELGFGNGSLLYHMASFAPRLLRGVELGDTLDVAKEIVGAAAPPETTIELSRDDLTEVDLGGSAFDLVYCIGVLHHLTDPRDGFRAVLAHTKPGGRFHCWVYAHEGNGLVRYLVDPLRRITSRLPWWFTKYGVALPLVVPFYIYAKLLRAALGRGTKLEKRKLLPLPLARYSLWIAEREFRFFHHVAFDQLVTPRTVYLRREEILSWLADPAIDPESTYVHFRNGNSWKFGGRKHKRGGEKGGPFFLPYFA